MDETETPNPSLSRRRFLGVSAAGLVGGLAACADSGSGSPSATSVPGSGTPPDGTSTTAPPVAASVKAALEEAVAGLPGAGQVFASVGGAVALDAAWGTSSSGVALAPTSLVPWASAVKAATCSAVMRLADAGALDVDDRVTRFIPDFGEAGKEAVLVRHLLTHSAHLGGYGGPLSITSFDATVASIVAAPMVADERAAPGAEVPPPGTVPSYNPAGIWILGEILRRYHDRPFEELIRSELFEPCRMDDCWVGIPPARFDAYDDRIVSATGRINAPSVDPTTAAIANPAGGGVGPINQLGRLYEVLLRGGAPILARSTVEEMTTEQLSDGRLWAWGLGLNLNTVAGAGPSTAPGGAGTDPAARYGTRASSESFGHNGATGTIAFADPERNLVVAMIGAPASFADQIYGELFGP